MLTRYLHKFNTICRLFLVGLLFYPMPIFADHVPTQPPYDQSIALDTSTGDLTVGIYSSDGFEDSPPEKYTIFFTISDNTIDTTTSFCVSTSFGHGTNLTWQYHVFSLEDLQYYFEDPYGTFRTKIRSDNDTDNSFSTLTAEQTITIPNQLPFTNLGEWTAPTDTCNDTSTTTTTTSTLPPDTTTSSSTTTSSTTTSTTTTTTTTTLPPPPPPTTTTTLAPVIVTIGGEEVEYTQEEVNDGTVERDQERSDNEEKYGCYMTNAQIERGDCFDIEEETEEEVIIILEDDKKTDDTEKEFFDDDDVVFDVEDEDDIENLDEEVIDLETLEEEIIIEIEEDLDLTEEEKQELIEVIKDIQETDFEEFVIEEEEIVFDEDDKPIDEIKNDQQDLEEDTQEVVATIPVLVENVEEEFTEEEIIVFVEEAEEAIEEIISVKEVVEILDQEELEDLSEEELIEYEEEVEEKIIEAVKELPVEEKVAVVEEVAKVSVQNLAVADKQTQTVVQAVVTEVVQPEVIETLDETQKEAVAEVLGVEETNDVEIIAEQAKKDDNINIAVQEYVERATENADVENYSVSNAIVEVQVEQFFEDPIGQLTDIDLSDIVLSDIGSVMTQSSKDNAKKTVVPVIIVSQIIATPFTRRF